jgi:hypothetical protein
MRSFLVALAIGFAGLLALGLARTSDLVYSPGVTPQVAVLPLQAGQEACQGPLRVPDGAAFDRVAFTLGTYFKPGPRMRVTVVGHGGAILSLGELPAGYADISRVPVHDVRIRRVQTREPIHICLANRGNRPVAVYGQAGIASPRTSATVDGRPVDPDLAITLRGPERSLIALLPTMADRAALFRAGWVTPGVYLVLALLLVIGAPLVLARGLAAATAAEARSGSDDA